MKRKQFRYTKEERRSAGWLNITEAAKEIGVGTDTFRYHLTMCYCPKPTKRIGNRLFYTRENFPTLREYWASRKRHQHHFKSYKYGPPSGTRKGGI
jgi:hypothetical protein